MDLSDPASIQRQLDELNLQIEAETASMVKETTPTPPPEPYIEESADPAEDLEIVNTLWVLKAGFLESRSFVELGDVKAASQSLDRLETKIHEFTDLFPNTLLSVDIARQFSELKSQVSEAVSRKWDEIVKVGDSRLEFHKFEQGDDIYLLFPRSSETISEVGRFIDRVLDLEVAEVETKDGLVFASGRPASLAALFESIRTLTSYIATAPPSALAEAIVRRYKSHVVTGLLHRSIPGLYPKDPSQLESFKSELSDIIALEAELKETGWTHSSEMSDFAASFDARWPAVRRGQYLAILRSLYRDAGDLSSAKARQKLVKPPSTKPADEWEWNDDDDDDGDDDNNNEEELDGSNGALVDLWNKYTKELGTEHADQFFALYRALTPTAYGANSLGLYADTRVFIQHGGELAHSALTPLANASLHSFVRKHSVNLETDLLPKLFGLKQSRALNDLKALIGRIAEEANTEGGLELRETILGQIVEQVAVYVITSIEERDDIGDVESSELASLIANLDHLGVFFPDVRLVVPSWYKLEMLGRVLMGSLATIEEMYTQHALADFSADELEGLLQALFVDSAARQVLIRRIHEVSS